MLYIVLYILNFSLRDINLPYVHLILIGSMFTYWPSTDCCGGCDQTLLFSLGFSPGLVAAPSAVSAGSPGLTSTRLTQHWLPWGLRSDSAFLSGLDLSPLSSQSWVMEALTPMVFARALGHFGHYGPCLFVYIDSWFTSITHWKLGKWVDGLSMERTSPHMFLFFEILNLPLWKVL